MPDTATKTDEETLSVQVGDWNREYVLRETTAGYRCDPGDAITLMDRSDQAQGTRLVLVPSNMLDWWENRCASGLHDCWKPEGYP